MKLDWNGGGEGEGEGGGGGGMRSNVESIFFQKKTFCTLLLACKRGNHSFSFVTL